MTDTVATMLQQLTHSQNPIGTLSLMIGAKDFLTSDNAIHFSFPGCRKANKARLTYDRGADLYTLELFKYNRKTFRCPVTFEASGLYAEDLKGCFERQTGLFLSFR